MAETDVLPSHLGLSLTAAAVYLYTKLWHSLLKQLASMC